MADSHYEVLGVPPDASPHLVRSAYRRLALKHHPDASQDPSTGEQFRRIHEAYQVLGDPERRKTYDETLESIRKFRAQEQKRAQERTREPAQPQTARQATRTRFASDKPAITPEVLRLSSLASQRRMAEAESLARRLVASQPTQAIPYAVLGDVERAKGRIAEAAKLYAYAAQFDPDNPTYLRLHDTLMSPSQPGEVPSAMQPERVEPIYWALGIVAALALGVALSPEPPALAEWPLISTWNVTLVAALTIGGMASGACLRAGNLVDRFSTSATSSQGQIAAAILIALASLVNFWAGAWLYVALGFWVGSFDRTASRLVAGTACATTILAIAAGASPILHGGEVILWGGNVVYWGAVIGWLGISAVR